MMTYLYRTVEGADRATRVEPALRRCEVGVGEDDAEEQQSIGIFHDTRDCGVAGRPEIRAGYDVRSIGQKSASHERGHDGNAKLARQYGDALLEIVTSDLDIDENGRRLGLREPR